MCSASSPPGPAAGAVPHCATPAGPAPGCWPGSPATRGHAGLRESGQTTATQPARSFPAGLLQSEMVSAFSHAASIAPCSFDFKFSPELLISPIPFEELFGWIFSRSNSWPLYPCDGEFNIMIRAFVRR